MRATSSGYIVFCALALLLHCGAPQAQTWSGGGSDKNWSNAANWVGNSVPASSAATTVNFFNASSTVDQPWNVGAIFLYFGGLGGQTLTFPAGGGIAGAGTFSSVGNAVISQAGLSLSAIAASLLFMSGPISGPGSVTIQGPGAVVLNASNTFTGGLTVTDFGLFGLEGSIPGPLVVDSLSAVGGNGSVAGSVTVSGGLSAKGGGTLRTGNLTVTGNMNFDLNGPTRATDYTGIDVNGAVNISGARLNLLSSYVPVPGDVFLLIDNDGTEPVIGTFAGLPEGAIVTINDVRVRISYVGGSGNDVTLAVVGPATVPALSTWAVLVLGILIVGCGVGIGHGTATRR
jgi:autotransporter-associated beta strand protein